MAKASRASFAKRNREREKKNKRQDKLLRRAERKTNRELGIDGEPVYEPEAQPPVDQAPEEPKA